MIFDKKDIARIGTDAIRDNGHSKKNYRIIFDVMDIARIGTDAIRDNGHSKIDIDKEYERR